MSESLKRIIEEAVSKVDAYKHPDLSEFKEVMTPIFEALDIGVGALDEIDDMFYNQDLTIYTKYYCRGCECDDQFTIPMEVIEAEDPVKAAKLYTSDMALNAAISAFNRAELVLTQAREALRAAEQSHFNLMESLK